MNTILKYLPKVHPLRNAPLIDIGAQYKGKKEKTWREVKPQFCIAKNCYNDLGKAWTDHDVFRSTKPLKQLELALA